MVFPSPIFLFLFLPLALWCHTIAPKNYRNLSLLAFSLTFYAWGEGIYLILMLYCIAVSWLFGLRIDNTTSTGARKTQLWIGISLLLAPLLVFKYLHFILLNIASLSGGQTPLPTPLHLPIGISFFTFQAMSYVIDVYRSQEKAQPSVLKLSLYISLFPQLIAGPIVRYQQIANALSDRVISMTLFASGVKRFIVGLAKKVLIANPLGYIADIAFSLPAEDLGVTGAWIGVICYALQIYFDFSGYSDMAIGLGRMFGFNFAENFNYPYISRSIREFWRRWHISLSSWFRDYVYIPLGGNRAGTFSTTRNLLIIFLLCGLWHGASWNFLIWGLLHGAFLSLERSRFGAVLEATPKWLQHGYVLLVVLVGWVFFRADNLHHSIGYLSLMFDYSAPFAMNPVIAVALDQQFMFALGVGILFSTPLRVSLQSYITTAESRLVPGSFTASLPTFKAILLLALLLPSLFEIVAGAYNPFIYFRF